MHVFQLLWKGTYFLLSWIFRIQPVYVIDVASAIVAALKDDGASMGKAYELGGPEIFTTHQLVNPSATLTPPSSLPYAPSLVISIHISLAYPPKLFSTFNPLSIILCFYFYFYFIEVVRIYSDFCVGRTYV